MLIDLSELIPIPDSQREYAVSYESGTLLGNEVLSAPAFALAIRHGRGNAFTVRGSGSLKLMLQCSRCLADTEVEILFDLDRSFDLQTGQDTDGDMCCFLQDHVLDTDELIREEAVLNLPYRILCREDCRGICERCGANLNLGPCGCSPGNAPTRMADAIMAALNAAKKK